MYIVRFSFPFVTLSFTALHSTSVERTLAIYNGNRIDESVVGLKRVVVLRVHIVSFVRARTNTHTHTRSK